MTEQMNALAALRRPRLLIRAARFGLVDYNRDRDLKRLVKAQVSPSPARAITALLAEEAALEETRRSGDAGYLIARHVEVLIALMGEARLMPQTA